jgi:amidase
MMRHHPMTYFALAVSLSLAGCSKSDAPTTPYAVEDVPLSQISDDLAAEHTTSVEVTKAYLTRIGTFDQALNAVILVAPDALEQAAASDARRAAGRAIGPLDGVPILLKDNIDAVGMPTTAGSYALFENFPAQDSEVTKRLRAAGAVLLGKTNLMQFAGFRTAAAFNSSTVGGGAHNPYDLSRGAYGSSSGSGVAGAVSFAAGTVGSDTDGSTTKPASVNGLVGLRPTIAFISRRGIVPISHSQDIAGPMTRTVMDAAMMMTTLAGSDPTDPQTVEADAHKTDFAANLDAKSLNGVRLGVLRGTLDYNKTIEPVYNAALEVMRAQGAELVEIPPELLEDLTQEQLTVLYYEFKQDLNNYLAQTPPEVTTRSLAELIAFNESDPRENMHDQDIFYAAQATTGYDAKEYIEARATGLRNATTEGIDKFLADYDVSALLSLSKGPGAELVPDGTIYEHFITKRETKGSKPPHATTYAAIAGYPMLSVPMGLLENGMPVGISFIGPAWSEQMLLSLGYAYEQASQARVPPTAYKEAAAGN